MSGASSGEKEAVHGLDALSLPLYRFPGDVNARLLPAPNMNIVNGDAYVRIPRQSGLRFQGKLDT